MLTLLPVVTAFFATALHQVSCVGFPAADAVLALAKCDNPNPVHLQHFINMAQNDPKFNVNCPDPDADGMTPMMYIVELPSQDCLRVLLATPKINVNAKDAYGYTALHFACGQNGQTGAVNLLIQAGAKLNEVELQQGNTPLIFAAVNGHLDSILLLINAPGIDVHKKNGIENNALLACISVNRPNSLAIAEVLVKEAKIDPFVLNSTKKDAFHLAILRKRIDILRMLLDAVNPNKDKIIPTLGEAYTVAVMERDREAALLVRQYMQFSLTLAHPVAQAAEAALFPNGF
jgi:ankyrin repeat protein